MQYFTISELCHSSVADAHGIPNHPSPTVVDNLAVLIDECLDPIREAYGSPIYVNSGYRCKELNKLVGGSPRSQHVKGMAADLTVGTIEGNQQLFEMIENSEFMFDQLIDESNYSWIHVSYNKSGNRKQILHLN